jgi:metal iron transporter
MPHNLILNSGLVQTRLLDYDLKHNVKRNDPDKPSLKALRYSLNYSYIELIISLFFIATFVNSAILIVSGATLYGTPDADDADLFSIYELLKEKISPSAGVIFALSMLMSGQSAGITTTMTGQMVSEGFIKWTLSPFATKMITRAISIVPVIFVTLFFGQKGIADILNLSQVILSMILPVVIAPLIYFTSYGKFMKVYVNEDENEPLSEESALLQSEEELDSNINKAQVISFTNGKILTTLSVLTFLVISFFNFYLIVAFLRGKDVQF